MRGGGDTAAGASQRGRDTARGRRAAGPVTPAFAADAHAVISVLALALALALALLNEATPQPRGTSAPVTAFAADRALPLLDHLVGDGTPHPVGSPANRALRERLSAELEALGLEVTTQTTLACAVRFAVCGEVTNLMTRLPGSMEGPAVLLTAHYDSVGAGPGVSDDLVGVVSVLETTRLVIADGTPRNPLIVLLTDGEEAGLLGAEAFVKHPWFQDVGVVVNAEARGTRGRSLMFETGEGNAWLVDALAREAPRPAASSLLYELYRLLPNDTDFSVYRRAGLNGMNFAYVDDVEHYHTPLDDMGHLDPGSLQHQGDNLLAATRALLAADLTAQPSGNSLYVDLAPGLLLRVPQEWGVPLAAACLLGWLLLAAVLARRRVLSLGRVLLGIVCALMAVAVAAAAGSAVTAALRLASGLPEPWYASPMPTRVVVWLAALLAVLAVSALFSRRLGFWSLAVGAWLSWGVLALAAALTLPGVSVMFLVPLVPATVLYGLAAIVDGPRTGALVGLPVALVAVTAGAAAAYLWLPLAYGVESALGLGMSAAIAGCLALAYVTFTPLIAQQPRRGGLGQRSPRWMVMVGCAVGVALSFTLALRAPTFSAAKPQRFTIAHVQEEYEDGSTAASWRLERRPAGPLPAAFAAIGAFSAEADVMLGEPNEAFLYSAAPTVAGTGPRLQVLRQPLSATTGQPTPASDGGRTVRLRLRAGDAGADRLSLGVPRSFGPVRVRVPAADADIELVAEPNQGAGNATLTCVGRGCDGLVLELQLGRTGPVQLTLRATSFGLPAGGEALQAARPATAVPSQDGDASVRVARVTVP